MRTEEPILLEASSPTNVTFTVLPERSWPHLTTNSYLVLWLKYICPSFQLTEEFKSQSFLLTQKGGDLIPLQCSEMGISEVSIRPLRKSYYDWSWRLSDERGATLPDTVWSSQEGLLPEARLNLSHPELRAKISLVFLNPLIFYYGNNKLTNTLDIYLSNKFDFILATDCDDTCGIYNPVSGNLGDFIPWDLVKMKISRWPGNSASLQSLEGFATDCDIS